MHRLLKDTGSIYLHCDPNASHYLKGYDGHHLWHDAILRMKLYGIIIGDHGKHSERAFKRMHDDNSALFCITRIKPMESFNRQSKPVTASTQSRYKYTDENGRA